MRQRFHAAIIATLLFPFAPHAGAQGLMPPSLQPNAQPTQPASTQPTTSQPTTTPQATATTPSKAPSLLDQPAQPAHIELTGGSLLINATNSSLSDVLRQLASDTGMQVEGNTRDERVFGSYGPGKPSEVLSALLYDSGYNVIMVGATADGAPRELLLSARSASASTQTAAANPPRSNEEDDEEPATAEVPVPQPIQNQPPPPGVPAAGQPRTPQQMLEELQRMHQGQQPQDLPHEPQ